MTEENIVSQQVAFQQQLKASAESLAEATHLPAVALFGMLWLVYRALFEVIVNMCHESPA